MKSFLAGGCFLKKEDCLDGNTESLGNVGLLDPGCEHERLAFEQAFYAAFARAKSNQLIRDLWIWDEKNCRIRTHIPYDQQWIFVIRGDRGVVETAMAVNFSQQYYQASFFGFSRPSLAGTSCEILSFFSLRKNKLIALHRFLVACSQYGRRDGVHWADATCTQRLLSIYMHLGADLLDSCLIGDELRHHIRFDISCFSQVPSLLRPYS